MKDWKLTIVPVISVVLAFVLLNAFVQDTGEVVLQLAKRVEGKAHIVFPHCGGDIPLEKMKEATELFVYYRTSKGNIKIDSIEYEILFIFRNQDGIFTKCSTTSLECNSKTSKLFTSLKANAKDLVIFNVTKIVLANGQTLLNPAMKNKRVYNVGSGKNQPQAEGVIFSIQ